MAEAYDLVVVGGGPGGYVAAIRAAQLGLKTALVEARELGGVCLNWGCIPTKTLLRAAEIHHLGGRLEEFGLSGSVGFDLEKVVARSRAVAGQLSQGVQYLLKKNKVTVISGYGRLAGGGRLAVESDAGTSEITAPHIILASGARPRDLPGLAVDGKLIWSYRKAMVPDRLPKSLLVVGSGAIGIEFASFYHELGAEVTVLEVLDRVLPVEDEEISALLQKALEKQGLAIHTGAGLESLTVGGDSVAARFKTADGSAHEADFERVIMAVGITGNVENMGLEEAGVKIDRGHVVIDQWCRTGVDGIYAIGDLAGPPWLAHKASHEGVICVEKIAGVADVHPLNTLNSPGCTYCRPQVASLGLSETGALAAGHQVRVGRFPLIGNGKAVALGEPEGLIKTVFDATTGELLGAHMIGAEVTEMIQGFVVAKTLETTEAELMATVFPHPTISEAMHESVLDAFDRALHF